MERFPGPRGRANEALVPLWPTESSIYRPRAQGGRCNPTASFTTSSISSASRPPGIPTHQQPKQNASPPPPSHPCPVKPLNSIPHPPTRHLPPSPTSTQSQISTDANTASTSPTSPSTAFPARTAPSPASTDRSAALVAPRTIRKSVVRRIIDAIRMRRGGQRAVRMVGR